MVNDVDGSESVCRRRVGLLRDRLTDCVPCRAAVDAAAVCVVEMTPTRRRRREKSTRDAASRVSLARR